MATNTRLSAWISARTCAAWLALMAPPKSYMRRKVRRETLIGLAAKLPPCGFVAMEDMLRQAHHLGRVFAAHGHDVRLMSPEYVRPYVKAQKNDDRDAEGIAEAATRPTMRFVNLKSQDQLDMQTLHRSRERLVGEREGPDQSAARDLAGARYRGDKGQTEAREVSRANLMDERGGAELSPRMILLVADARKQWAELDRRIAAFDAEFVQWAKENRKKVPSVDDDTGLRRDRRFGSRRRRRSCGKLRPRPRHGGLARSGSAAIHHRRQAEAVVGISKRGNRYLRKQLIHGARAALPYVAERDTPLGGWAKAPEIMRAHHNVAVVAFANKLARIAWAVLRREKQFAVKGVPLAA